MNARHNARNAWTYSLIGLLAFAFGVFWPTVALARSSATQFLSSPTPNIVPEGKVRLGLWTPLFLGQVSYGVSGNTQVGFSAAGTEFFLADLKYRLPISSPIESAMLVGYGIANPAFYSRSHLGYVSVPSAREAGPFLIGVTPTVFYFSSPTYWNSSRRDVFLPSATLGIEGRLSRAWFIVSEVAIILNDKRILADRPWLSHGGLAFRYARHQLVVDIGGLLHSGYVDYGLIPLLNVSLAF